MAVAPNESRQVDRLAGLLAEGAGLLIAAPLWAWWAVWKGGYPAAVFLPGVAYLALAAVVLHVFAARSRLGGPAAWALVALAVLTAWSLASLLWADDKGAAEIATARQVLLLGSFALPLLWPPSARALTAGLALLPAIALAGGASGLAAATADAGVLLDGRLVDPTGYANASAALMAIGILPALLLASRRELPAAARVAMLTAAGPLLGIFVLTQSRGGVASLALVLLLALALIPGRLRLLIPVALVALAVGAVLDPLLDVRAAAVDGGDDAAAIDAAVRALALMTAGLALLSTAYVLADTRLDVAPATVRRASRLSGVAVLAAVSAAATAIVLSGASPGSWVSERVEDFKTPDYSRLESERTRFTGDLGSNRYDYWRVSADVFAERPLGGSGAGNFIAPFLERRRADKATIYSHNLWLGTLAQLGAVGFLALVGFLAALLLALSHVARRSWRPTEVARRRRRAALRLRLGSRQRRLDRCISGRRSRLCPGWGSGRVASRRQRRGKQGRPVRLAVAGPGARGGGARRHAAAGGGAAFGPRSDDLARAAGWCDRRPRTSGGAGSARGCALRAVGNRRR